MALRRRTQSVSLVLEEFQKESRAMSAIELVERFRGNFNKTTIYRILDRLEGDGIVHSFLGNSGIKWYAKCHGCSDTQHVDTHPHFECTLCGKVECLDVQIKIPDIPNRKIKQAQMLIKGLCETCSH